MTSIKVTEMYPDKLAERLKARAGSKWRPSNGTEGEIFMEMFCERCVHDASFRDGTGTGCDIAGRTLAYDVGDPGYPTEWQIGQDGQPVCTAFDLDHDHE